MTLQLSLIPHSTIDKMNIPIHSTNFVPLKQSHIAWVLLNYILKLEISPNLIVKINGALHSPHLKIFILKCQSLVEVMLESLSSMLSFTTKFLWSQNLTNSLNFKKHVAMFSLLLGQSKSFNQSPNHNNTTKESPHGSTHYNYFNKRLQNFLCLKTPLQSHSWHHRYNEV